MSIDTGGPAFPSVLPTPLGDFKLTGMTLRDYFAGQALTGMLAYSILSPNGNYHVNCPPDGVAHDAYLLADAMLKAREERK